MNHRLFVIACLCGERMYLSNHLNYYNHCWDGNAWISALTLWDFQGPESVAPNYALRMSLSRLLELNPFKTFNLVVFLQTLHTNLQDCVSLHCLPLPMTRISGPAAPFQAGCMKFLIYVATINTQPLCKVSTSEYQCAVHGNIFSQIFLPPEKKPCWQETQKLWSAIILRF